MSDKIQEIQTKIDKQQDELKKWSGYNADTEEGDFEDKVDYKIWYKENRGDINYIKGLQEAVKILTPDTPPHLKNHLTIGLLTEEESKQFTDLINKGVFLCQWYEKEHVDENMTDEEWQEFVDEKELAFADACEDALDDIK